MIGTIDILCNAKNPNMPLWPLRAFINSPSSLRISNVPRKIGKWQITNVRLVAEYPDSSVKTADCVLVGGVWVGTIDGSTSTGTSENGYTVFANGVDENGDTATGYVLGKGDVEILDADGTLTPGEKTSYVHLLSAQSEDPKDGDLFPLSGEYYIWQDGQAHAIGDDSGAIDEVKDEVARLSAAVHGDYIEDDRGNKINADRTAVKVEGEYAWVCVSPFGGETMVARGTYENASYFPDDPEENQMGVTVTVNEGSSTEQGYNDFSIGAWYWREGEWAQDSGGTNGLIPVDGTHYEDYSEPRWIADWEWQEESRADVTLATVEYVDAQIGDIAQILEAL